MSTATRPVRLTGYAAINEAERRALYLNKYEDPTEESL